MTTAVELVNTLREDLLQRYRSPILIPFIAAILLVHWRVVAYLWTGTYTAAEVIAFIEANVGWQTLLQAGAGALFYAVAFPWVELVVAAIASPGKRRRHDFHAQEVEREQARRKLIAQQQAALLELELKNSTDQGRLVDIDLVKQYQSILSTEALARWARDLESGPINYQFVTSITNYLSRADSVEGKFINEEIQSAHAEFVSRLSTLQSAVEDIRANRDNPASAEIKAFATAAVKAQGAYRTITRRILSV